MNKLLTILAISILFAISCIKEDDKTCPTNFIIEGSVQPYAETYKVGDTITLQAKFHHMIYEEETGNTYNFKNIDTETGLYIYNIDTIADIYGIIEFVDIIPNSNYKYQLQNTSSGSMLFANNILDEDTFRNEIKIVLKLKGVFMLNYGPFILNGTQAFEGYCKNSEYQLDTYLNRGHDNNIFLLKDSPNEHFNSWIFIIPEERFYGRSFAYRVIE